MKQVALWVVMFFVAIICIPLSWMISTGMPFNLITNAFFNSSNATIAFYILQILLMIIVTETMIQCCKYKDTIYLQWANVIFLIAFVLTGWYLYYLVLALASFLAAGIIQRSINKEKDEITTIIEEVKEEYMDQTTD